MSLRSAALWPLVASAVLVSGFEVVDSAPALRQIRESSDPGQAQIRVRTEERSAPAIPREITGKFAEHLGYNIYNGMDAQILRNPTFADYPFWNGQMNPDGVTKFQVDTTRITDELRGQAKRFGWPESDLNNAVTARADGLASFWGRFGERNQVQVSPDTSSSGGRAQRVQVEEAGQGIVQWTWLPLHRVRHFKFELFVRSPNLHELTVSIWGGSGDKAMSSARLTGLSPEWKKVTGALELPADAASDLAYRFVITAPAQGQFIIGHAFLWPADNINGADPDIVRLLREAHLPLLRWPGGNFVSTYHWQDGIGPLEQRPTRPNLAWGGVEPNTFGTDEFIAFCRAVGCEPMICINAGSGTPEEAAQWIEYCNGLATSPMGRLRAAAGHSEPFGLRRWEVGNELWGRWQMRWTTATGYVDRFQRYSEAMLAADSTVRLYACGAPAMSGKRWNDTLISGLAQSLGAITDHPLIGGSVSPARAPTDIYQDFMAVPEVLQRKWAALQKDMAQGGIRDPRLAVTELQLFAHIGSRTDTNAPVRLTSENFPGQGSITEAVYDILVYHAAIRLEPFVELITHSAVVNHGGGLRKERERVWANPCYYAQAAFADFGGAIPVPVEIEAPTEHAPMVLPDLTNAVHDVSFAAVDALAAVATDGSLLLSIVNRSNAQTPLRVGIELEGFSPANKAQTWTLAANAPWEGNSLEHPDAIRPVDSIMDVQGGKLELELRPYSVVRVRVPSAAAAP
jgi:alpha-N-arabinofuranosidase